MSPENIGLILIVGYLGWWLFNTIGKQKNEKKDHIEIVSDKNGKIIKMTLSAPVIKADKKEVWNDDEFLNGAKIAFHMICNAFSKGKKKELKIMLAPSVYDAFIKDIETREHKKQIMDFSLVCLSSAKVLNKAEAAKEVTVQFISEQINILKDEKGNAIEGDPMNVALVEDIWTFRQQKNNTWIVCATQSEATHG